MWQLIAVWAIYVNRELRVRSDLDICQGAEVSIVASRKNELPRASSAGMSTSWLARARRSSQIRESRGGVHDALGVQIGLL
jgi:hypothetical protein